MKAENMSRIVCSQIILLLSAIIVHDAAVHSSVYHAAICALNQSVTCMTLEQLAVSSPVTLTATKVDNLTIVLSPGTHNLNATNFSTYGIPYVSMTSSAETGDSRINCYGSARFMFKLNTLVHISGLALSGCLDNEVDEVEEFIVEDCRLTGDREQSGRALVVVNSTVHIARSDFRSFYAENCRGGAIYCSMSSIIISECTFSGNSGTTVSQGN